MEYFEDEERTAVDNNHPRGRKDPQHPPVEAGVEQKGVGDTLSTDDGSGQAGRQCAGASPAARESEDEGKEEGQGQGQGAGEKSDGEQREEEEQKRSSVESLQIEVSGVSSRNRKRNEERDKGWTATTRSGATNDSNTQASRVAISPSQRITSAQLGPARPGARVL